MIPPYETAEVAEAVRSQASEVDIALRDLLVVADLRTREWRVAAILPLGERIVVSLPFTTSEGIVLPAEVASHFMDKALEL